MMGQLTSELGHPDRGCGGPRSERDRRGLSEPERVEAVVRDRARFHF
jgi:hypothetical protein